MADAVGLGVVLPLLPLGLWWIGVGLVLAALVFRLPLGAAQQGFDAGVEFARAERFADVVVCAEFQPEDAVGFFVLGGEHDNGQAGMLVAQGFEVVKAVDVGQAYV